MQTFAGLRDSSLPRPGLAPAQYGTVEQCMRNPVLFSVWKNILSYTIRIGSTGCIKYIHIVEARHIDANSYQ